MILTPRLYDAITLAIETHEVHQKQKRKGKDIPYLVHPFTAGIILARAGASEDVVIAGILHDTIEDSVREHKVSFEMIAERFGTNVADLVQSVTEPAKKTSWDERKQQALEHIAIFSHDSLLVKSADLVSNISDLVVDHKRHGDAMFAHFNAPKEKIIAHYKAAIELVLARWPANPFAEDLQTLKGHLEKI